MKRKKLMLLGGSHYLMPAIEAAHKLGAAVITCDYLPDNYAHKFSDAYYNISVIDKDAVLAKARELEIDGILGFANDAGVVPAAYVATQMGLPTPPLESVEILQNKDKFRDFLAAHGFNCPWHKNYPSVSAALADRESLSYPCIVKPVDSCGSKGVTMVKSAAEFEQACEIASKRAFSGRIIVEEFLRQVGSSSDTDCFSIDNELVFCSFNCQHFDAQAENPYTPAAFSWPSDMPQEVQVELRSELQRLIRLLNIGSSVYNVETRLAENGKPYIMEVSPRTGGNRLSECLKLATGQDLIENNVRGALGLPLLPMSDPVYNGAWAEFIVHSNKAGKFVSLDIDSSFAEKHLVQNDLWVSPGDSISEFTGANQTIGTLVLKFESHAQAEEHLAKANDWHQVVVKG